MSVATQARYPAMTSSITGGWWKDTGNVFYRFQCFKGKHSSSVVCSQTIFFVIKRTIIRGSDVAAVRLFPRKVQTRELLPKVGKAQVLIRRGGSHKRSKS